MPHTEALELLQQARQRFTQAEIAKRVGRDVKTVRRWEKKSTPCPQLLLPALKEILYKDSGHQNENFIFSFIDLFAGIGGIRMGFEKYGGKCVFTSEWNEFSKKTYLENYGHGHEFVGYIVPVSTDDIPNHDLLLAGFPCQPFSIAGVSKKMRLADHTVLNVRHKVHYFLMLQE